MAATGGFEPIAAWYDAKMGQEGDRTHRHLLLPALLAAAGEVAGRRVLDVGCGSGLSSRALAERGARVLALDLSPSLVARARTRQAGRREGIAYLLADAAALPLAGESVDLVAAHMVLMDAADGAGILGEAGRVLRPGGRLIMSLLHPCFEPPQAADWSTAPDGATPARRIWRYRELYQAPDRLSRHQPEPITRYHRPLSWYADHLRRVGLCIDTLDEPLPVAAHAAEAPAFAALQRVVPAFLIPGAEKAGPAAGV